MNTPEEIWREYENGKKYLEQFNYYENTEECLRYYNGDQWHGLKVPNNGEVPPILNIIEPVIKYKVGTVNSNGYAIQYTPMGYEEDYMRNEELCSLLNQYALTEWERLKMDSKLWTHTTRAAVTGDSYAYFMFDTENDQIVDEMIDNVSVLFADEQQPDIQKQKYILIQERKLVSEIKEIAKFNKVKKADIDLITSDNDTEKMMGDKAKKEIKSDDDGKAILITKFWKEDGVVHMIKSTKSVIVHPDTAIIGEGADVGMRLYPIAHFRWKEEHGACRGQGDVLRLINNQREINKANARYSIILKQFAMPHIVYDTTAISDEEADKITTIGAKIGVEGNRMMKINELVNFLQPPQISSESWSYAQTLLETTRNLAGAADAVTGNIDPTRASGVAIQAVQDAAALPLNDQQASLKQFVEDVARIWIDIWQIYKGVMTIGQPVPIVDELGQPVLDMEGQERMVMERRDFDITNLNYVVKVDVSPSNPYSKYSQEQTLLNFLTGGLISFEDYVEALPDDASAPKSKLQRIVDKQRMNMQASQEQLMMEQAQMQQNQDNITAMQSLMQENAKLKAALAEVGNASE